MKVLFIAIITITLLSSCRENPKNGNGETQESKTTIENKEEMLKKQNSVEAVSEENRKLDSIQQVRAHGHAH